jgi:bifunctional non-homologous end joining protein LigD
MAVATSMKIGGKTLNVSNPDKVLYPVTGFTKRHVIDYYIGVAPAILPHLKGRPLTLKRYPNGVSEPYFYEKRCPAFRPDWMHTADVKSGKSDDRINFCVIDDVASLVWVANLASLELHTLLCRQKDPTTPTAMVFDLDPGAPANFLDCVRIGLRMRDLLSRLGLECFPKTSGSKGLHLWVPLNTPTRFDRTKEFAHAIALLLEREDPPHVTSVMKKELRAGKIFVDWSQNDDHKTTVCVYSLRAREQPTVSTPMTWRELQMVLQRKDLSKATFQTSDVLERIAKKGDLFEPVLKLKQKLPKSL